MENSECLSNKKEDNLDNIKVNSHKLAKINKLRSQYRLKNMLFIIGVVLVTLIVIICVGAPLISPNDPLKVDLGKAFLSSTNKYPLGTDQMGRCILSRILYGGRTSIFIALLSLSLTVTIGTFIGILSAVSPKIVDSFFMGICEITLAFPGILLAIVIVGFLGPSVVNVMVAISFVSWAKYARVSRNLVLSIRESGFIKAAKVCGTSHLNIIRYHIIPNIFSTILTIMVTDIGSTILRLATLSFIGLGAQHPTPEWGVMINEAREYIDYAPNMIVYPIIMIFLTVASFNLIGDSLRDRYDGDTY